MKLPRYDKQKPYRVLVIDDDKGFRVATRTLLEDEGFEVHLCTSGAEALEVLREDEFDIILTDLVMEGMTGIELLEKIRLKSPTVPVIMITGFGSIQSAVDAMKRGATDYLTKPSNNDELLIKIRRALDVGEKERELKSLREEIQKTYSFGSIVTRSKKMKDVLQQVRQVADTDVTVYIQGESGTGKELVARALHFSSVRGEGPFVAVNCSAIPENLLESELFGHERGAFTGALKRRIGKFEEAQGGTLFLDEIGDIAPSIQVKLLRVLQEKQFSRLGDNVTIHADVRVVVATNRNLEVMVRQGEFRDDLYYRLSVFPITLPPLRDRVEDIPLLAEHFLHMHTDLSSGREVSFAPNALAELLRYPWPGNIRELENVVKRAMIKAGEEIISSVDLPYALPDSESARVHGLEPSMASFKEYMSAVLSDAEQKYLVQMLKAHKGNVKEVARLMEIDRKTVYRKLSEYSIDPSRFRD